MSNYNVGPEQAALMLNRPWNDCSGFAPFLEQLQALTPRQAACEICSAPMGVVAGGLESPHLYCSEECLDEAFKRRNR